MRTVILFAALPLLIPVAAARADADKATIPQLIKELRSSVPRTRMNAAQELGHLGAIRATDTKDAVPVLLAQIPKEKRPEVRRAFILALSKMDPDPQKAVPLFVRYLKDRSPVVRSAAADALAQLGEEAREAIPALQEARNDKDKAVSRAARIALRSIQGKK